MDSLVVVILLAVGANIFKVVCMVPSLATLLEKSYLTKTNPRAPEQQGVLQHKNGKCVKAYLPAPMKVTKNIPESQSALVRLVKNCKYADEWQITESFVLRNKNYNLTVHPYNLNTKDQTKVKFLMAYALGDSDHPLKNQFLVSPDGTLFHYQTSLCVKIIPDNQLVSEQLRNKNLLGLYDDCMDSSSDTFEFKSKNDFHSDKFAEKVEKKTANINERTIKENLDVGIVQIVEEDDKEFSPSRERDDMLEEKKDWVDSRTIKGELK